MKTINEEMYDAEHDMRRIVRKLLKLKYGKSNIVGLCKNLVDNNGEF